MNSRRKQNRLHCRSVVRQLPQYFHSWDSGHCHVEEKNVRLEFSSESDRFFPIPRFCHDHEIVLGYEQPAQTIAENCMVIGDKNSDRPRGYLMRWHAVPAEGY